MENLKELVAINSFSEKEKIIEYLKEKFNVMSLEDYVRITSLQISLLTYHL